MSTPEDRIGLEVFGDATLDGTVAVFRKWLHLPDPAALYAVLGTVAANRLPGDSGLAAARRLARLGEVGDPASGRIAARRVPHRVAHRGRAAIGHAEARERPRTRRGGLLRTIGDYGIILAKDFGSILSLHHDSRSQVLAALREVYDGSWTRPLGTDGGKTLHWEGKVGLIAGCTPTIDRHHAVMGAMGERFVLLRLSPTDAHEQGRKALAHAKQAEQMRAELSEAVAALFEQAVRRATRAHRARPRAARESRRAGRQMP